MGAWRSRRIRGACLPQLQQTLGQRGHGRMGEEHGDGDVGAQRDLHPTTQLHGDQGIHAQSHEFGITWDVVDRHPQRVGQRLPNQVLDPNRHVFGR